MTRRLPLFACLALLATAPASAGSWLQDAGLEDGGAGAAERLGIRPGSHELQIFGGAFRGERVFEEDRVAPPLTAEPVQFRIELEGASSFGIGYWYQAHERWAVGAQVTRSSTEFSSATPFDRMAEEAVLFDFVVRTEDRPEGAPEDLSDQDKLDLLDRIEARSRPRDVDLTMVDVGAIYIINPEGPWIGEVGGGLGWASASSDEDPMLWEQLFRNSCDPSDSSCRITIANAIPESRSTQRCEDQQGPCAQLESASSLTWHVQAGLRYAFTDAVQLRLGLKLRVLESITDPGGSLVTQEGTLGLAFRFGGR